MHDERQPADLPVTGTAEADLQAARRSRLEADRSLDMSERLEKVHRLCLQIDAIAGAASEGG